MKWKAGRTGEVRTPIEQLAWKPPEISFFQRQQQEADSSGAMTNSCTGGRKGCKPMKFLGRGVRAPAEKPGHGAAHCKAKTFLRSYRAQGPTNALSLCWRFHQGFRSTPRSY